MTRSQRGRNDGPRLEESLEGLVRRIAGSLPRSRLPVHLYLDVSGSVEPLLGLLCEAARGVAHLVCPEVHLFSTDLVDARVGEPATAACQTTGGTSIAPVARHIRQRRVLRAVVVTDGEVGPIGARDRETLGETILGVALTGGRESGGELAGLARHVVVLAGRKRRARAGGRRKRDT